MPSGPSVRSDSSASAMETATVPCTTCRKRRVKCDKRIPGCTRCEKSGQPCPGYNRLRSFLDQGEALRQKYSEPTSPRPRSRKESTGTQMDHQNYSPIPTPPVPYLSPPAPQQPLQYHNYQQQQQPHEHQRQHQHQLQFQSRPQDQQHQQSQQRHPSHHSPQQHNQSHSSPHQKPQQQHTAQPTTSATGHFVPSHLDPVVVNNSGTPQQETLSSYMSLDSLSESDFEATFFDIDPNIYFAEGNNCCGWIPNAPLLNDLPDSQAPTISWLNQITPGNFSDGSPYPERAIPAGSHGDFSPPLEDTGCSPEDEYETAHLIQHFSQHVSPYLDVFDIEKYFGHVVPARARRSNLLTNSLAAIAAKQFAKTRKELPPLFPTPNQLSSVVSGGAGTMTFLDQHYTDPGTNWFYKAASFYDKAICQMMGSLQSLRDGNVDTESSSASSPKFPDEIMNSTALTVNQNGGEGRGMKRQRTDRTRTPANVLDDLLAAVSIFLLYESMDNRQLEINQHMSGAQHLLMENLPGLKVSHRDARSPAPLRSFDTVKAWQASFWNVVRIDYVVAYVERGRPRLNTDDQYLWQAAGLPLRDAGNMRLVPESLCTGDKHNGFALLSSSPVAPMTETAACRTLLWIVLKALVYAAEERDAARTMEFMPIQYQESFQGVQRSGVDTRTWYAIREYLDTWLASLPESFEPYLRLPTQQRSANSQVNTPGSGHVGDMALTTIKFPTLQYSSPMASTAMVMYHFIQIFLLLHKPLAPPPSSSSPHQSFARFATSRLDSYRRTAREIDDHANKICGISLGRPDDAVRMHMVQPLHLAGLSLEGGGSGGGRGGEDRRVVLEGLLGAIQKGTGCSTEWVVTSLREEWGWNDVPH